MGSIGIAASRSIPGEEVEEEENRRASYTYHSFSLYYVVADTYAIISLLNQPISSRMTALAPFSNQTFFPQSFDNIQTPKACGWHEEAINSSTTITPSCSCYT